MAYTALADRSPQYQKESTVGMDLKSAVLRFIRVDCEGLRFNAEITMEEQLTGELRGTSISRNMIPYNMQMDVDRLCLECALCRFLDSGISRDAFDVYYCYLEMFIGDYSNVRWMVELLSEYEANGSSLLLKHRDHYVHSVYVFALGLAIYETNANFRSTYKKFYGLKRKHEAAHHFLRWWGMTALFHDIGYPFELPFEQVAAYFEVNNSRRSEGPIISYRSLESYTNLDEQTRRRVADVYGTREALFETTDELFAWDICNKLGKDYYLTLDSMERTLREKPTNPEKFNYFMDHAYFSATVLFKKLYEELKCEITKESVDALTAIVLHNSLYKFTVAHYKDEKLNQPFAQHKHPLAWLLMLCDELQCWDRKAYGRNSRSELHPLGCNFTFAGNGIQAAYLYDEKDMYKRDQFLADLEVWKNTEPPQERNDAAAKERFRLWEKGKPRLKACSDMMVLNPGEKCAFQADIESIVDTTLAPLTVSTRWIPYSVERKHTYLSESNFLHLFYFAVALHGRWINSDAWKEARREHREMQYLTEHIDEFIAEFGELSLEYKLSNINQAKSFDGYLNEIDCFYTDKPVDMPRMEEFTETDTRLIGPMEHARWLNERTEMGWRYGTPGSKSERENTRLHMDMVPPELLPEAGTLTWNAVLANYQRIGQQERDKDVEPLNVMLMMLRVFDGVSIYQLKMKKRQNGQQSTEVYPE